MPKFPTGTKVYFTMNYSGITYGTVTNKAPKDLAKLITVENNVWATWGPFDHSGYMPNEVVFPVSSLGDNTNEDDDSDAI